MNSNEYERGRLRGIDQCKAVVAKCEEVFSRTLDSYTKDGGLLACRNIVEMLEVVKDTSEAAPIDAMLERYKGRTP